MCCEVQWCKGDHGIDADHPQLVMSNPVTEFHSPDVLKHDLRYFNKTVRTHSSKSGQLHGSW